MSDQTIRKDALRELPNAVQERINETDLRSHFEGLTDYLDGEHITEDKVRDSVGGLLSWLLAVFGEASEPLTNAVFQELADRLAELWEWVNDRNWANCDDMDRIITSVLRELSSIPTVRPQQSTEEAQLLNESIRKARSALRGSETRLESTYKSAGESLQEEFEAAQARLAKELEASQTDAAKATEKTAGHRDEAAKHLKDIEEILKISTDTAWGGTYDTSAQHDQKSADRLRRIAFGFYGLAVLVGIVFAAWNAWNSPAGWEWLSRVSLGGGPVAVLLFAAAYASRESSEHRNSSRLLKHQSLAFISLDKYANRIAETTLHDDGRADKEATEFLRDISGSLFTKQIDAHTDQIKAQGRGSRVALKLGRDAP